MGESVVLQDKAVRAVSVRGGHVGRGLNRVRGVVWTSWGGCSRHRKGEEQEEVSGAEERAEG